MTEWVVPFINFKSSATVGVLTFILNVLIPLHGGVAESREPVFLGGIFDLSADGKSFGIPEKNGTLLAIEDFNAAQQVYEASLLVEDSRYSLTQSVSAFQKLTATSKSIPFIIGPTWEPCVAILPLCERKRILCIAPSCLSSGWREARHYSFSFWFDDRDYGGVLADEARRQGVKRIVAVATSSSYYDSLVEGFVERAGPLAAMEKVDSSLLDFRSIITRTPRDVDALFVALLGSGQAQAFLRQWSELRAERPIILTDDAVLYYTPPFDFRRHGMRGFYSEPDLPADTMAAFSERYRIRFGKAPEAPSGAIAYDSTALLLGCVARVGVNHGKVRDCIAQTSDYRGYSGNLTFDGAQVLKSRRMRVQSLETISTEGKS